MSLLKHCAHCDHAIRISEGNYLCDLAHELVIEDHREIRCFCMVQAKNALDAIVEILDIEH